MRFPRVKKVSSFKPEGIAVVVEFQARTKAQLLPDETLGT